MSHCSVRRRVWRVCRRRRLAFVHSRLGIYTIYIVYSYPAHSNFAMHFARCFRFFLHLRVFVCVSVYRTLLTRPMGTDNMMAGECTQTQHRKWQQCERYGRIAAAVCEK